MINTAPTLVGGSASSPATDSGVRATVAIATVGVFVSYLPINAVSISLGTIAESTGATTADLQWVTTAYVIPMAAAVLSAGVFGDRFGRRRMLSLGLALTAIGSILASLAALSGAGSLVMLWTGQAVAGLGGGILLPTTLALISHAIPDPRQRAGSIAMWATGTTGGLAVGPLLSGLILQVGGWGWIFAPTIVLSSALIVVAHKTLPESKDEVPRALDIPGQTIASIAIVALIFGVTEGGSYGWSSAPALIGFGVGGVCVAAFIWLELRRSEPLMDVRLFRSPAFSAAALAGGVALFSIVGLMFLLSLFLTDAQTLTPWELALRLVWVPGTAAIVGFFLARAMRHLSPRVVLTVGLALGGAGMFLTAQITETTNYLDLVWRLAIFGFSVSLVLTSVSAVAVSSVPRRQASMGASTNTALRQLGGALGPAVLGSVFAAAQLNGSTAASALNLSLVITAALLAVATLITFLAFLIER